MMKSMSCRTGCGACCIAPSLSTPLPGMPAGKPAGIQCAQLDENLRCRIYGLPDRPAVCDSYRASEEFCGASREEALRILGELENLTSAVPAVRKDVIPTNPGS